LVATFRSDTDGDGLPLEPTADDPDPGRIAREEWDLVENTVTYYHRDGSVESVRGIQDPLAEDPADESAE
jgi:hypothetical protein